MYQPQMKRPTLYVVAEIEKKADQCNYVLLFWKLRLKYLLLKSISKRQVDNSMKPVESANCRHQTFQLQCQ